jgi:hypothetical protein
MERFKSWLLVLLIGGKVGGLLGVRGRALSDDPSAALVDG